MVYGSFQDCAWSNIRMNKNVYLCHLIFICFKYNKVNNDSVQNTNELLVLIDKPYVSAQRIKSNYSRFNTCEELN